MIPEGESPPPPPLGRAGPTHHLRGVGPSGLNRPTQLTPGTLPNIPNNALMLHSLTSTPSVPAGVCEGTGPSEP